MLTQTGTFGLLASVLPRSTLGCCQTRDRTQILRFKVSCPTVRRSGNIIYSSLLIYSNNTIYFYCGLPITSGVLLRARLDASQYCVLQPIAKLLGKTGALDDLAMYKTHDRQPTTYNKMEIKETALRICCWLWVIG